jgi:type I restriction enzyme S subunit
VRDDTPFCVQRHISILRPSREIDSAFLALVLSSSVVFSQATSFATGTAQLTVPLSGLRRIRIPLPPREEQGRIVTVIEEHFSRVDAGAVAVDAVRRSLGRMRSSLLASILRDPSGADWPTVELGDVLVRGRYGTSTKCSYGASGLPVLRIPNIQSGTVSLSDLKRAVNTGVDLTRTLAAPGDVLVIRTNGSRSLIGRAAVVPPLPYPTAFASYLIQLRVAPDALDPAYLVATLSSPRLRAAIEKVAATTAGQYNINLDKLRSIRIPLPPLAAQVDLMAATERRLSLIHGMDDELVRVSAMAARLRSSILAAAFAGELVAQEHGDEHASVLLERIAHERSGSYGHIYKPKVTLRKKATA